MKGIIGEDQGRERERFEDFYLYYWGFPGSSASKESTCSAGGIGYSLHYPWASLVAQMVKNPPAMQEG